jgi:hypothetical protein
MSRGATAAIALLGLGLGGCATFAGRPRAFDEARLAAEPGWIAAAHTPAVRQQGPLDCGAAALAMVLGRWQVVVPAPGPPAPPLAPPSARLGDLRDAARAHGLSAFAIAGDRATLLHELGAGRPILVGLATAGGSGGHFEVVVAGHPSLDQFVSIDPASGWRVRGWSDLDAAWRPPGRPALVVLGPAPPAP